MDAPVMDIEEQSHQLVVLKVLEKDAFGRPVKCEVGYADTTYTLQGGEEFVTAWIPEEVAKLKVPGQG